MTGIRHFTRFALVAAVALGAAACASGGAGAPEPRRYAVIVGIDDYPGTDADLDGSVADAQAMRQLLMEQYGFRDGDIRMLLNGQARRSNIINAFRQHLGQAQPNDVVVFYFSGHGMQLNDNYLLHPPVDNEPDGRDESIVVWDDSGDIGVIVDDELGFLTDELQARRALVMIDACHSGTVTRASGVLARQLEFSRVADDVVIPQEMMPAMARWAADAEATDSRVANWGAITTRGEMRHLLLSGSAPDEVSWAMGNLPGFSGMHGLFTTRFITALRAADASTTFAQVMNGVRSEVRETSRRRTGDYQTPQIEGAHMQSSVWEFFGRTQ
ncbi:MAG TPA: caspase family protein [Longimicrobiales bacterium]|nr:caspase family protein [Longimicrobiales bacterium]